MAFNKTQKIDKVEFIGDWKQILVRHKITVTEDGTVISESYHRENFNIELGVEGLPLELQPYATGVWTDELVSEWNAYYEEKTKEQELIDKAE